MWDTSCPDWADRLLSGRSLVPDLPLFRAEADKALRIFKRLRIPDMPGKPTMGDVAGPWLFPIVEAIFGSFDVETNKRMIQEFFWLIPKKNTKTSSAAAIAVEAMILNRRPEGEFVLVAPTIEVANISFKQAAGTIRADDALNALFQITSHQRTITHRKSGATLKVKAADTDVITGGKQVGTIVDELHVLADKSESADILVEIRGALTARQDGFLIIITTQSKKPPAGVFKAELAKARAVRDGEMRLPLLPILYELPPSIAKDGGWRDRKYWPLVNPNLGRSVNEEFLERELASKNTEGVAALALFASQHFNVEIGVGLSTDNWAGAEFWEACADPSLTLEALLARCEVIVVGIDGGGLDDLLGLCVIGRERVTGKWLVWFRAWAHRIVLDRRKEVAPRLLDFEAEGSLKIVDVPGPDVEEVADIIIKIDESGLLPDTHAIAVDRIGIGAAINALALRGFDVTQETQRVVAVSQGYELNGAIKDAERILAGGQIVHDGSALGAWCAGNAKIEPKGNAVTITKQVAGSAKIDPLMAFFDAISLMKRNPSPNSVYETQDLRIVEFV